MNYKTLSDWKRDVYKRMGIDLHNNPSSEEEPTVDKDKERRFKYYQQNYYKMKRELAKARKK